MSEFLINSPATGMNYGIFIALAAIAAAIVLTLIFTRKKNK